MLNGETFLEERASANRREPAGEGVGKNRLRSGLAQLLKAVDLKAVE